MKKSTNIILSSVAASILLIGCGGGGGGSTSSSSTTGTVSGSVVDGKVAYAKVCLDLNFNKICDEGEPFTQTDIYGKYSLKYNLNDKNVSVAPVLVVPTLQSYDTATGNLFTVKLSSPREGGFVIASPITTLAAEKVYELAKNGNISEQNITTIIKTVTEIIKKDTNATDITDITKIDPTTDNRLLATAVLLTKVLQDEGNLSGVANDLNDSNSSLTVSLPGDYKDMYKDIVDAVSDENITIESPEELQQIVESAIEQNNTTDLKNIVTETNQTKVYEYLLSGYLDGVYKDLEKNELLETDKYNITGWDSSDVAKQVVEDYNITNVDELINKIANNEVKIEINARESFVLNDVINTYLSLMKTSAAVQASGKEPVPFNYTDINGTAVFDLATGKPVYFNNDNTYTSADKNGTWEVLNNVLVIDGKEYDVIYKTDNSLLYITSVQSDGTIEDKELLVTDFNQDTNFTVTVLRNLFPAAEIKTSWNVGYIFEHIFEIDGNKYRFAYSGDVYDSNDNKVGVWDYDGEYRYLKMDLGNVSYFIILKSLTLDKVDYFVIKTDNNIVKEIKEETSENGFNFAHLDKMLQDSNMSAATVNKDDLVNKEFLIEDERFVTVFDENGTYIIKDTTKNFVLDTGVWELVDNKYLVTFTDHEGILNYAVIYENKNYAIGAATYEAYKTERLFFTDMIPTTITSAIFDSSQYLIDNFNVKPSLFSFDDINGSVYEINIEGQKSFVSFNKNGTADIYTFDDGSYSETSYISDYNWTNENGLLALYNERNKMYIVPVDYEDGEYVVYFIDCVQLDENRLGLDEVTVSTFKKSDYPLKSELGTYFGYDWYNIIAKYPGDERYTNNEAEAQDGVIKLSVLKKEGNESRAEISTTFDNANQVTASLSKMQNITDYSKGKFFTATGFDLQTQDNKTVSLYAGMSVSDSKVYFWGGEYNGVSTVYEFSAGSCDYNLSLYGYNVTLSVATNGSNLIVYNVYNALNGDQICSQTYDVSGLNLSGTLSFDYGLVGVNIDDSNSSASSETATVYLNDFKVVNMNLNTFVDSLDFTPVAITDNDIGGKVIATDVEDLQNGFMIMHTDGSFYDDDTNLTGKWSVSDNILTLNEGGIETYVAFKDINGSIASVSGYDIEDGFFEDKVLLLNADENTVVENVNDFLNLFDNEPVAVDINGTNWTDYNTDENITFDENGTFTDSLNQDGIDVNITGTWSVDSSGVIIVDDISSPEGDIDTLVMMYVGKDENNKSVFVGVGLDANGEINSAFLKTLTLN